MEWISVEDRLPEYGKGMNWVLAWFPDDGNAHTAYRDMYYSPQGCGYEGGHSDWVAGEGLAAHVYGEPSHWMPLPEPPHDCPGEKACPDPDCPEYAR